MAHALGVALMALALSTAVADAQEPAAKPGAAAAVAPVNLNTATVAQLVALPGIGMKTAERIVEYRQKNGGFKKVEEILETVRTCPYSLSVLTFGPLRSVSRSRQKSQ